ncbi:PAS domain S-box protein [Caldimonas sp. KR1-144]|uniref:hybrid sensor histidine kinase/response regulator n=1 Tax=Caldimonas sp. KR1-144 TaxID=3400911 RepID=UPI003C0003D3
MTEPLNFEAPPPPGAGALDSLLHQADGDLLRAVLDALPARVIVLDREERCIYLNHEFFAFTGLHPKQVLGRHIADVIGRDTYDTYIPARERLWRGEPVRWEGWTELAGQGRRYMREHLVPYGVSVDAPGQPSVIVVMSRDLTELKEHEAELQAQVERLQATEALKSAIVDHALAALVSADEAGVIVEFNPAAEAMFGVARGDAVGRLVAEVIIPPRHRAAHAAGMARLRGGAAPRVLGRRIEIEALRADGSEFPIEMVLWRTMVHGVAHYTASISDLTEQRRQADEIERQREALRQSEKLTAMGSLLAGVAHELNNPLAIVMGRASLLEAKCADDAELRADAQRIREAAERCGRIVRTFLGMARQRAPQRAEVQLNDMVRGAIDLLHYNLRSGGVEVELRLADGMPAVLADPDQLGQVLLNLLVNAQQALSSQPAPRRIVIESGAVQPRPGRVAGVWLRVADNGPGVPVEIRSRIFDPFFTTKAEGTGTGLGLGVSRSLVREFGGDLILETEQPDGGACFRFWVPVPSSDERAPLAEPDAQDSRSGIRARILVVDDEPELAALLQEMLEAADYEVAIAESGEVALALAAEARFDAVVSDLRMPGMDGAALWRALREQQPQLARHIVFVTGDTLSPGSREFLESTGCACLEKPFAPSDLVARVQASLDAAAA